MYVYAVKNPEGWLYRDDALMVFLGKEEAEADAPEPDAEVMRLKAAAVTGWLEAGDVRRVRLVSDPGEHYFVGSLEEWRELVEHVEAEEHAMIQRALIEMVNRGELAYDPQTGEYTNLTLTEE